MKERALPPVLRLVYQREFVSFSCCILNYVWNLFAYLCMSECSASQYQFMLLNYNLREAKLVFWKHKHTMLLRGVNMCLGTKNRHSVHAQQTLNIKTHSHTHVQRPYFAVTWDRFQWKCACVEVFLYKRGNACGGSDGDRWFGDKSAWESGSLPWD